MVGDSVNSGDYTWEVTRVPIPNTTVKLSGPMIVPTSAKVGHCRIFYFKTFDSYESKVFLCAQVFELLLAFFDIRLLICQRELFAIDYSKNSEISYD